MRFQPLSNELRAKWEAIPRSRDGALEYVPCQLRLRSGDILPCAYVQPLQPWLRSWGVSLESEATKRAIAINEVVDLEESPARLPPAIANTIYAAGESGMGYCVFTLVFRDGSTQACSMGNAVDFVRLSEGHHPPDVVAVQPHVGREEATRAILPYVWCLFDGFAPPT
ncbi:MAG TPA: hypothetical protein VFW98_12685 [Gemmatimonadaceae bacterium]|nr:hypothetical protein [Gemmatimonadaceae bacterium]